MTPSDFTALLPILMLGAFSVAVMLAIAVRRNHAATAGLTASSMMLLMD